MVIDTMEVSSPFPFVDNSTVPSETGLTQSEDGVYSDDDIGSRRKIKQNKRNVTNNNSDLEQDNVDSLSAASIAASKRIVRKSRIRKIQDSDNDSDTSDEESPNVLFSTKISRLETKRNNLLNKFKNLASLQSKKSIEVKEYSHPSENESSEKSDSEISCLKIKNKIKNMKHTLSSVCDADTSEEENNINMRDDSKLKKPKSKPPKEEAKGQPRMSAKQAIEIKQKIKSESNRMLREKNVSLPYHRPKALSLQDIMKCRKTTLNSDGKAMPIKMNDEQLKQYVKLLEERQKEMIELCKSESDEECPNEDIKENAILNISEQENNVSTSVHENMISTIPDQQNIVSKSTGEINMASIISELEKTISFNLEQKITLSTDTEPLNTVFIITEKENNISEIPEKGNNFPRTLEYQSDTFANQSVELSKDEVEEEGIECDNRSSNDIHNEQNKMEEQQNNSKAACLNSYITEESQRSISPVNVEYEAAINNQMYEDTIKTNDLTMESEDTVNKDNEIGSGFSDNENDLDLLNIDKLIEDAEIVKDDNNDETKVKHLIEKTLKPRLIGSPGMFIDLESGNELPKKLSGVELLKERFTYFSKFKSAEDKEKNKEAKHKPGTQHLKLKCELEEQIAEQRRIEWEKRLEEERLLKSEMEIEPDDDIENLEAKLEDESKKEDLEDNEEKESLEDEDLIENDVDMRYKPKTRNPMIDDEAVESDEDDTKYNEGECSGNESDNEKNDSSDDESSSESEEEPSMPKKGRILKAFEDSDDESNVKSDTSQIESNIPADLRIVSLNEDISASQDDKIQMAQVNRSTSEDIFATQESVNVKEIDEYKNSDDIPCTADLGSQTFSILSSAAGLKKNIKPSVTEDNTTLTSTPLIDESKFDSITNMRPESLSQNILDSQPTATQSQEIGDDILALCTGKFYDNPFVSQLDNCIPQVSPQENVTKETTIVDDKEFNEQLQQQPTEDGNILNSILEELNEPEIEKKNKYFSSEKSDQVKKRFIIHSDEEEDVESSSREKKKLKKRKRERRPLQISDDEDEESQEEEESEIDEEAEEKIVDYDSEENEIEVTTKPKKKRMGEFFENEAELTSEDEWVGSGDEDEAGLDRMEREEGDSDVFQQDQLQRELGQIHMRDVLDQDKREVRLLQELLFEDGDLGDGHRQRKFRWRTDDDDETGMGPVDLTDTQEEEFESEELWRKQRHERELFLRSMKKEEEEETNRNISRTAIIKANLNSRSISSLTETKPTNNETISPVQVEAKLPTKDIPSLKKPFMIFQQSYHGSLLKRGRGALARLAALATPLADADAPRAPPRAAPATNFVFAALTPDDDEPKAIKRKADSNAGTPKLLKKMKRDETQMRMKNSLFDHFKT